MIRHIAFFKFTPGDAEQRAADLDGMRDRLVALVGVIPGLRSMSVEPDLGVTPGNWEVALVSEHDDRAAFETYQAHPAHTAASVINNAFISDRIVVDVETAG
jgi:hypothetical protein